MKIKHGTRPSRIDHRDYDYIKSHNFGAITAGDAQFPDEFFADAGLTMPNQETVDAEYTPPTPAMPFGCTNYTQADLATDLTKQIHNPNDLEAITHANAKGGLDIRESLDAARKQLGWFKNFYNIRASGRLDFTDSFRLAQITGLNQNENRAISWGTPWFLSWEQALLRGDSIMPMPTTTELNSISSLPWHNSKLDGWTTKNGILVYRDKSLQGNTIGDRGFIYFPREVINVVMGISGTVGFTATNIPSFAPQTIDITRLQYILSLLRSLIARYV